MKATTICRNIIRGELEVALQNARLLGVSRSMRTAVARLRGADGTRQKLAEQAASADIMNSVAEHPFRIFYQQRFRVCLNTDNRLMSNTTISREFEVAAETFDLNFSDFEILTMYGMKSAFLPYDQRFKLIHLVLKAGHAKARGT